MSNKTRGLLLISFPWAVLFAFFSAFFGVSRVLIVTGWIGATLTVVLAFFFCIELGFELLFRTEVSR